MALKAHHVRNAVRAAIRDMRDMRAATAGINDLRSHRGGNYGARRRWRVTLTLATGEVVATDIEQHFEAMALSLAKARLRRGDVVVAESVVPA